MQIWLKNHNSGDIFYTSQKCSFIPLCLDFTKLGTLPIFQTHFYKIAAPVNFTPLQRGITGVILSEVCAIFQEKKI